jgi:CRP-like cAMP-binding protein
MYRIEVGAGTVLVRQGDEGDTFFVIKTGVCSVFVRQASSPRKTKSAAPSDYGAL